MDPARLARVALATFALATVTVAAGAATAERATLVLVADRDDDDGDGKPDGAARALGVAGRRDVVALDVYDKKVTLRVTSGGEHVRVWDGATLLSWGSPVGDAPSAQGISPGVTELSVRASSGKASSQRVEVWGLDWLDAGGARIDPVTDHVSLTRTPPSREASVDPDAVTALITAPDARTAMPDLTVESLSAAGIRLDALEHVALASQPCGTSTCFESSPLRLVVDEVDRSHPLAVGRSLRAEVGGAVVLRVFGRKQVIRVLGPRSTPAGPIGRLRATLRPFVLRMSPGGMPAIGGNDAAAAATVRADLAVASAVWGQCGVSLGDTSTADVHVVDPPPPYLLALGAAAGLPSSGGELRFTIDGKATIVVPIPAGASIDRVARETGAAIARAGWLAIVSPNARASSSAQASVDLLVRRRDNTLASLDTAGATPLSSDRTLTAQIGSVELAGGLEHFGDDDSPTGTLEERTLVKALDDGDPSTLELVIVPFFAGTGRIGESFIASESPSMRNVILLDRGGVRARRTSLTLAHELGHVLLSMPGHPDDYGEDTPTFLLDSDASDASPFGPKRIPIDECARVLRESGPLARVPLLTAWPVTPLVIH